MAVRTWEGIDGADFRRNLSNHSGALTRNEKSVTTMCRTTNNGCDLLHLPRTRWAVADRTTEDLGDLTLVKCVPERQQGARINRKGFRWGHHFFVFSLSPL